MGRAWVRLFLLLTLWALTAAHGDRRWLRHGSSSTQERRQARDVGGAGVGPGYTSDPSGSAGTWSTSHSGSWSGSWADVPGGDGSGSAGVGPLDGIPIDVSGSGSDTIVIMVPGGGDGGCSHCDVPSPPPPSPSPAPRPSPPAEEAGSPPPAHDGGSHDSPPPTDGAAAGGSTGGGSPPTAPQQASPAPADDAGSSNSGDSSSGGGGSGSAASSDGPAAAPEEAAAVAAAAVPVEQGPDGPIYYITAEEVEWDYAPSGKNLCNGEGFDKKANAGIPATWTVNGMGRKFKKAIYRRYANAEYQEAVGKGPEEQHTGLLGPLLRVAVGQTLTVSLKNNLPFEVNFDPAGLQLVGSDTPAPTKPGSTQVYRFNVPQSAGPTASGPTSKLWLYRSTVDLAAHGAAGLFGPVLISNTTEEFTSQPDVVTVLTIIDENSSPFYDENLKGRNPTSLPGIDAADALAESNLKHTINGFLFCNMPPPVLKQAKPARWHMASVGSETDVHNMHLHGNTFLFNGHRADQANLLPGSAHSMQMNTDNAGTWLMHCHIGDHIAAGMKGMYIIERDEALSAQAGVKKTGVVRQFYIAAVEEEWDYLPSGGDQCSGSVVPLTPEQQAHAGGKYKKAIYREFADEAFTTRKAQIGESDISFLGILGPILRAEVGDTIRVTFKNLLTNHSVTIHPHGVAYAKSAEGSPYSDGTSGDDKKDDEIKPFEIFTYEWQVPESSGPGPADLDTVMWTYHSHVDEVMDVYAGLQGAIIIGRAGSLRPDTLTSKAVDRELVLFFTVINEAATLYSKENAQKQGLAELPSPTYRHVINGFSFCNLRKLEFVHNQTVRFHLMALGTEIDIHTPNMEGQTLSLGGEVHSASVPMMPGSMWTADVVMGNPGVGTLRCRVAEHVAAGMQALLEVAPKPEVEQQEALQAAAANTVRYYIQAELKDWDYAPQGVDACAGTPFGEAASVFLTQDARTIGRVYKKALYVEYDQGFASPKAQALENGLLGPLLRAEVGQQLEVVFRNGLDFPANLVLDGGLELISATDDKGSELPAGAPVAPRGAQTVTYRYLVLNTTGPGPEDLSVIPYAYTSSVDPVAHSAAGLVGVLAVGRPGAFSGSSGLPDGVAKMVPLLFAIMDENVSPLLNASMGAVQPPQTEEEKAAFHESNLKHAINGRMYCNLPGLGGLSGSTVRLLLLGMGGQMDLHSVVLTGHAMESADQAVGSSVELLPTVARTVDVTLQDKGKYGIYCAVHDHFMAGMRATLEVQ